MKQPDSRIELARDLIEAGLPDSTIARRIMHRFSVVRSTAYCDIRTAHDQIAADDDGPATFEPDVPGLVAELIHDAQSLLLTGNYKDAKACIAMANTLKRWRGSDGPDSWQH